MLTSSAINTIKGAMNMCIQDRVDGLASRHIAKLLTRLGSTIAPVQEIEIKRQFRFFAEDVMSAIDNEEKSDHVPSGRLE